MKTNHLFTKLNMKLSFSVSDLLGDVLVTPAKTFTEYDIKPDHDEILNLFKEKLNFGIEPERYCIVKIASPGVGIHTDNRSVALNYYLTAHDGTLTFFKPNKDVNISSGLMQYDRKKMNPIYSFSPKKDECYLLNTRVPHSVSVNRDRFIYRILWNKAYSYEQIQSSLSIINE